MGDSRFSCFAHYLVALCPFLVLVSHERREWRRPHSCKTDPTKGHNGANLCTNCTLVVGIFMGDSYEGHKAFWREHHEDLLKKKKCSVTAFLED